MLDDAEVVIAAYGVSARISKTAIAELRRQGIKAGMIRPITIYPFPYDFFNRLDYGRVKNILCAEMSIPCQMIEDVKQGVANRVPISTVLHSGGIIFTADEIVDAVLKIVGKE
jgi:2-oxoglutarate ferredoxin oxidoreductase subunit alpha